MAYRIVLVDDHALFRAGLKMILTKDPSLDVVAEAASGKDAIEAVRRLDGTVDLVVLDINLPDQDGIEVARAIRAFDQRTKVLIVTMYGDEAYLKAALKAGADGYVIKQAVDEEFLTAVKTVLAGQTYVYPTLAASLFEHGGGDGVRGEGGEGRADSVDPDVLSAREREVLRAIALGYTQREIGESLFISEKTVETYKSRLLAKLGVERRSDLVRYAFEHGIVQL